MTRITRDDFRIESTAVASLPIYQPVPQGFSAQSSIQAAEQNGVAITPRERPKLETPKHYMLPLISLYSELEGVAAAQVESSKRETEAKLDEIRRLDKEKEEVLIANAKNAVSLDTWTVYAKVAQGIASTASIAAGIAVGGPFGAVLAFSGAVGVLRQMAEDVFLIENEQLKMGFSAVQIGTSLVGGIGAASTGAFSALAANATHLENAKRALGVIQTASTVANGTTQVGMSLAEKRHSDMQKELKEKESSTKVNQLEIETHTTDSRNWIGTVSNYVEVLHKAIKSSEIESL